MYGKREVVTRHFAPIDKKIRNCEIAFTIPILVIDIWLAL